jgi:5-oxoprolinase (ATP-hydrolysing) subunit A
VILDLNADVGEGLPHDAFLFELITSANVACGVHAGSPETMRVACASAAVHGVVVGAHPSFADREGFGRRALATPPDVLRLQVEEQVEALRAAAAAEGATVRYVKPHGALYHRATVDAACAAAIVGAAGEHGLAILGWPESQLLAQARAAALPAVAEGFADRAYSAGGASLVARGEPGAVLDPAAASEQAVAIARDGRVRSICVHGDSPDAPVIAARVRAALVDSGVELRPFA